MITLIRNNPAITILKLSQSIGIIASAIDKNLKKLKEKNNKGGGNNKYGAWVIVS